MENSNSNKVVIYFNDMRMLKAPKDKVRFEKLGDHDVSFVPDYTGGVAIINWDNVCFTREWVEHEEIDP